MLRDRRATDSALISSRRHDERSAHGRVVEDLLEFRLPLGDDVARAMLKFRTRAPAFTQSMMASANSPGLALGASALSAGDSRKIGRTSSVQPGQIAGATRSRRADRIPAT